MAVKVKTLTVFLLTIAILTNPSSSATESFVFAGCSKLKYTPSTPYESTLNSLLTTIINSATFTSYRNFTIQSPSTNPQSPQDTIYGLFQCRGDLSNSECGHCVSNAVSQLGNLCLDSYGGSVQLEGCFVKYDNTGFFGVEDKTEVVARCGPLTMLDSDELTRRDSVLAYVLGSNSGFDRPYRSGGSGDAYGVGQCVGDLSPNQCQDCLSEAIGRLRTECTAASSGDMYFAKCYVRYSVGLTHSHDSDGNDDEKDFAKPLAIAIGVIVCVALLVILVYFLRKWCRKQRGCKH